MTSVSNLNKKAILSEKVDKEHGLHLLLQMKRVRRLEETAAEMYSKMKIRGFLHLYIGEEAVATGVMENLHPEDNVLCTYREHGHALLRGLTANSIMAEMYGKVEGCSKGRGGSMHLFDKDKNFFGGNAIVAGHLPMAVGMALANKKQGKRNITACFFGEGAVAEGEFHESMNLASLFEVPVLFICENNRYAMGTALRYTHPIENLEIKAEGYGMAGAAVDGMDVLAVEKAADHAIQTIKETGRPYFLVCNTYRFRAHSMFDAELYREKAEVEKWKERDPIDALVARMKEDGLVDDNALKSIDDKVEEEMKKAVAFAEAGKFEPVETLTKYVYSE